MDGLEVMPLERDGYEFVSERTMSDGTSVTFWCPVDPNMPSLDEIMEEVYLYIGEAYMRKQQGHPL